MLICSSALLKFLARSEMQSDSCWHVWTHIWYSDVPGILSKKILNASHTASWQTDQTHTHTHREQLLRLTVVNTLLPGAPLHSNNLFHTLNYNKWACDRFPVVQHCISHRSNWQKWLFVSRIFLWIVNRFVSYLCSSFQKASVQSQTTALKTPV